MSEQNVGLAMLGCAGDIQAHRDAAARLDGGAFSVVVDPDPDRARTAAEAVGAAIVVPTLDEALDAHGGSFEAIVLRTPLPDRLACINQAAQQGKHVHVEAPLALNLDDTNAAIDTCAKANVYLSIGNTLRALPSNRTIKARVVDNKLGIPGILRGHRWWAAGNSTKKLSEHIYGDIDLAAWLFEAMPSEIYALGRGGNPDGTMPEYLQVHLGFPNGGMALLDFATALPEGQEYHSYFLIGSTGAAHADDHHNAHLLYRGGDPTALISREDHRRVTDELQGFVTAIRNQVPPPVTGEDARIVQQIINGVAQSLESNQPLTETEGAYEPV